MNDDDPMERLRALYRIDRQLIKLKRRLLAGQEERAQLEREVAAAEEAQKAAEETIRRHAVDLDRVQLDARTAQAELADQDRKLRTVKNSVEYRIVTDRVKELRQQIDDGETDLLQGMETLDRHKAALAGAQAKAATLRARRAEAAARLAADADAIRAEQEGLKDKRRLAVAAVRGMDEAAYGLYDDALRRTKGDALGTLSGGVCQSCFMRQNPAVVDAVLAGRDLRAARCGGCGRLLSPAEADG